MSQAEDVPPREMDPQKPPKGLKWRSAVWFITAVVGLGITTDLLVYSIVIPVLPFQLQKLGYDGVSALVGWLLFGYSGGLVISTPLIAWFSERYSMRTYPMIVGQVFLIGSQIMLMEAPTYWVMVLARILQGISSTMVWTVGLALICDTVPEAAVGRQLGLAMTGLSLGILIGPPVGGALYTRFGFRGPFILSIIATLIDLIGRIVIIERKEALKYGYDPAAPVKSPSEEIADETATIQNTTAESPATEILEEKPKAQEQEVTTSAGAKDATEEVGVIEDHTSRSPIITPKPQLSLMEVLGKLLRLPRALSVLFNTLVFGIVYSSQEPALPLHLQAIWNFDSQKTGLVFIAAVVPTLISSPVAGWTADRYGTEWITAICILCSIPWWALISTLHGALAGFIVVFALESLFTSAVVSPLTAELAAVSRVLEGVGYAHVYGAFNLCYGIGSAIGPLIGGQIYDHVRQGWLAICLLAVGLLVMATILSFCYTGDRPLLERLKQRHERSETEPQPEHISQDS